jgi:GAF domain-containing protein
MYRRFFDPLARCTDVRSVLDWLLQRGIDLSQTSFGNVQLMNWKAGYLEIKAQRGFDEAFLRYFKQVRAEHGSACGRALRTREPIVIEDIMADEEFIPCRETVSRAGIRAVQSTPIISSGGALLGVLSTHFASRHQPTKIQMREIEHAARIAADALIRIRICETHAGEQIKASIRLLEQSRDAMKLADELLLRSDFALKFTSGSVRSLSAGISRRLSSSGEACLKRSP